MCNKHIVLAKCGGKCKIEKHKNNPLMLFNSANFCKLAVLKKHSLCLVEIELSVPFSPHFANTFSVIGNDIKITKSDAKLKKNKNKFCSLKDFLLI